MRVVLHCSTRFVKCVRWNYFPAESSTPIAQIVGYIFPCQPLPGGTESRPLWWPCVTVCRRPGLQVPVSAVQSGLAGQHLQTILSSAAAQATFALPPDIASSMLQQQLNEALRQSAQQPQPRVVAVAPAAGGESGRGRDSNTRCSTRSPRHTHGTGGKRGSGWIG